MDPGAYGEKNCILALAAQVDAGKTTVARALLERGWGSRSLPSLDYLDMESRRGITVLAKEAWMPWAGGRLTLLDTPGHGDLAAERDRALTAADACLWIVDGSRRGDGPSLALAGGLAQTGLPVVIFVNKMDRMGLGRREFLGILEKKLPWEVVDMGLEKEALWERLALCHEELLEEFLSSGALSAASLQRHFSLGHFTPVFFGAAARGEGVEALTLGLEEVLAFPAYGEELSLGVYKISRDSQNKPVCHVKVLGGALESRQSLAWGKVKCIRVCQGGDFAMVQRLPAGWLGAVDGWEDVAVGWQYPAGRQLGGEIAGRGEVGEGDEAGVSVGWGKNAAGEPGDLAGGNRAASWGKEAVPPMGQGRSWTIGSGGFAGRAEAKPLWKYAVRPLETGALPVLRQALASVDKTWPELYFRGDGVDAVMEISLSGNIQKAWIEEVLEAQAGRVFSLEARGVGHKESLAAPALGWALYAPEGHFGEMHILLLPRPRGGGLMISSRIRESVLPREKQEIAMEALWKLLREVGGPWGGGELEDMEIVLAAGSWKPGLSKEEDIRQAAMRALAAALSRARVEALWPREVFGLELPMEALGGAMALAASLEGQLTLKAQDGSKVLVEGELPSWHWETFDLGLRDLSKSMHGWAYIERHFAPGAGQEDRRSQAVDWQSMGRSVRWHKGCWQEAGAEEAAGWLEIPPEEGIELELWAELGLSRTEEAQSGGGRFAAHISREEIEEIFARTFGERAACAVQSGWARANVGMKRDVGAGSDLRTKSAMGTEGDVGSGRDVGPEADTGGSGIVGGGAGLGLDRGGWVRSRHRAAVGNEEYLLVDGYNILFAWEDLAALAREDLSAAREALMDRLSDYQGYTGLRVILVFDAYRVRQSPVWANRWPNIQVVFTEYAQTADAYIEQCAHRLGGRHRVWVATSDALEQLIVFGSGALRLTARELAEDMEKASRQGREWMSGD